MKPKIDAQVAHGLHRIKNDAAICAFLDAQLSDTLNSLALQKDDVAFRQAQGKAQYLFDLRELIEKSPELVVKLGA